MLRHLVALILISLSAAASYPSAASAGLVLTPDGLRYAPQHRWWRDDGRSQRPSQPRQRREGRDARHRREGREDRQSRDARDDRRRSEEREDREAYAESPCAYYELHYLRRHRFDKPRSLARYHGCTLHRRDYEFHAMLHTLRDAAASRLVIAFSAFLPSR